MNKVYCCYPGGKHKALTMSYDDGRTQDRRLIGIFNENGIRGTFHLNSGRLEEENRIHPEEIAELYRGHEIACHTVTHPTIARCPLPEAAAEVLEDRKALERITGTPVRGMSYPNGSYSDEIVSLLPGCGIRYSRITGNSDAFTLPADPYRWKATCHHNHHLLELGDQFLDLFKKQYLYLMYVWGHSYEFEKDGNWNIIEKFAKDMGGHEDIWYATNIEIVDYMDAASRIQVSVNGDFAFNPSAISVWLEVDGKHVELKPGVVTEL